MKIRKATPGDAKVIAQLAIELDKQLGKIDPAFHTIDEAKLSEFKKQAKRGARRNKGCDKPLKTVQ